MTVSRTINGHPYVSATTAKKVRAAIRKLDYRPNHAARMLTGQLSRSIGLIARIAERFPSLSMPFKRLPGRVAILSGWLLLVRIPPSKPRRSR